jgi:hypothetical protein
MLRAELWVHKNKTFKGMSWVMMSAFTGCCHVGQASLALAAVLGQKTQHRVHAVKLGTVNQIPAAALLRDQIGMQQLFQVKRQGRRRDGQLLRQRSRGQPDRALHHQQAEYLQTVRLRQCGQGFDNVFIFHISIIMEIDDREMSAVQTEKTAVRAPDGQKFTAGAFLAELNPCKNRFASLSSSLTRL